MKICLGCKLAKPIDSFSVRPNGYVLPRCKQCYCKQESQSRKDNPEKYRARDMVRHHANRDARLAKMREYSIANAEKRNAREKERYLANADEIKRKAKEWRTTNRAMVYAMNAARRGAEKLATPRWQGNEEIAEFYRKAERMFALTGIKHHVDHIVPLKHPKVCGLHVPWNLQVIPAVDNLRKVASFVCA